MESSSAAAALRISSMQFFGIFLAAFFPVRWAFRLKIGAAPLEVLRGRPGFRHPCCLEHQAGFTTPSRFKNRHALTSRSVVYFIAPAY